MVLVGTLLAVVGTSSVVVPANLVLWYRRIASTWSLDHKETKRQRDKETKRQRGKDTKRRRGKEKKARMEERKKISRDEEIIRQRGNFKETKRTKGQRKRWIKGEKEQGGENTFCFTEIPV